MNDTWTAEPDCVSQHTQQLWLWDQKRYLEFMLIFRYLVTYQHWTLNVDYLPESVGVQLNNSCILQVSDVATTDWLTIVVNTIMMFDDQAKAD